MKLRAQWVHLAGDSADAEAQWPHGGLPLGACDWALAVETVCGDPQERMCAAIEGDTMTRSGTGKYVPKGEENYTN